MNFQEQAVQALHDANEHASKGQAENAIFSICLSNILFTQHLIDKVNKLERKLEESEIAGESSRS